MFTLNAEIRKEIGKKTKKIRKQDLLPAVLYGPETKTISLKVKYGDFLKIYQKAGESAIIKLNIKKARKEDSRNVLIHQVSSDPVLDKFIHIDFYQVKMSEKLRVEIPLVFIGVSRAVEENEGVLIKNITRVEIEALPKDLPHEIEVDISSLKTFEDNICLKDLEVPEEIKIIGHPEEVVATIVPPRSEQELEELEGKPEEKVEEIEKVGEKKEKKEEEPEKETDGSASETETKKTETSAEKSNQQ